MYLLFSAMNYDVSLSLYQRHLFFLSQWRHNLYIFLPSLALQRLNIYMDYVPLNYDKKKTSVVGTDLEKYHK